MVGGTLQSLVPMRRRPRFVPRRLVREVLPDACKCLNHLAWIDPEIPPCRMEGEARAGLPVEMLEVWT